MFFRPKVVTCPRNQHCISRKNIDPDALRVLQRLSAAGHTAYLVGGGVRDLLLGRVPKDFDVSTDAHPGALKRLFRNCFLIGRRFRLAHIIFGKKIIETSTFRRQPEPDPAQDGNGEVYQREDNTFGTPEEDAKRRDFTVNALFYDIKTFAVIDYVGGLKDLAAKTMRTIGDPNIRFREDPVRMMRAARLAARLGFRIDWASRRAMRRHAAEIHNASAPRVQEEIMRLFTHRAAEGAFRLLWEHGLLQHLMPDLHDHVQNSGKNKSPLWAHLRALDADPLSADASNSLRLAVLFYPLFREAFEKDAKNGRVNRVAHTRQIMEKFSEQYKIPKMTRFTTIALIEGLARFDENTPDSPRGRRFASHPLFPQALALRRILLAAAGEKDPGLAVWETAAGEAAANPGFEYKRSRGRRRRFGRRRDEGEAPAENAEQT
ncbi:MAG: polynucleotide adenylyltransferase PcnB [Kiritimatiellaeota bacterium]|nr:polynucleotide adenylyltransferase PcnB [Kiritimatiellota bacterium]